MVTATVMSSCYPVNPLSPRERVGVRGAYQVSHFFIYPPHPNLLIELLAIRLGCLAATAKALVIPEGEGIATAMEIASCYSPTIT